MLLDTIIFDGLIALVACGVPAYLVAAAVRRSQQHGAAPGWAKAAGGPLAALLVLTWVAVMYGSVVETRMLQVGTQDIVLQPAGPALAPRQLTVALISDTHLGQYRHREWLETVVARVNGLKPDLVLVAGDIASTPAGYREFQPFKDLQSRFGTYAVLGNWDYRAGAVDVRKSLGSQGVKLLVNRSVTFDVDGRPFSIIGLDDVQFGKPDLDAALVDVPADAVKVVLSHNPDAVTVAEARGMDLVLAGHTHCGQIRLPFVGAVPHLPITIGQGYDCGYFTVGQTRLFITPGVGESTARARFFDPPEISLLRISF